MKSLTPQIVYDILRENFPRQNDYSTSDYIEEHKELLDFGITTQEQLSILIVKHKDHVIAIDQEDLDEQHIQWYREDGTIEKLEDKIANRYWFTLAGLLRITLELEFKEEYVKYANSRDGFNEN